LNGSDVEGGTSFECGYAKGIGKKVIGLRNDKRENHVNGLNLMLAHGVSSLANTIEDAIGKIK
jgi:nucleoside 2-deoxyribosyltransferase